MRIKDLALTTNVGPTDRVVLDQGTTNPVTRLAPVSALVSVLSAPLTINAATYVVPVGGFSFRFTTTNCTVTLPAAASSPGRILVMTNISANSVVSADNNVKLLGSNTAGSAILAASAGKFAYLQSDGNFWIVLMAN